MTERKDTVWQKPEIAEGFLAGIRGAIPCAREQIEVMLRIVAAIDRPVERFMDVGCGGGALAGAVLEAYPDAEGALVDFSPAMLDAARQKLGDAKVAFYERDLAETGWREGVAENGTMDAVVSGYAIHHLTDERKRGLYAEIYELLAPGGVFVNIEHVTPTSAIGERLFEDHFVENLYAIERTHDGPRIREQIREEFRNRDDTEANILATVEDQLGWLRDIGYENVDCHFRLYELAVFAGFKAD